jgi:hypothetical protein
MFNHKGILKKKVIAEIKPGKVRSDIIFTDGTTYKMVNTLIHAFRNRYNDDPINEKVTFITHDEENIKFIMIRDIGALDVTIPPLP